MNDKDIKNAYLFGNVLLNILKWLILLLMVISIGFTLSLIVFAIIYGVNVPRELLDVMAGLFINVSSEQVNEIIMTHGMGNLIVTLIGYGIAKSLTRLMLFILADRGIVLYKSITLGDLFTRKSNRIVDEMMGVSFLATFTTPIIVLLMNLSFKIDINDYVNVGYGCIIIFMSLFILRIILNRGIDVERELNKYDKDLNNYKADIDELKIQSIKRDAELKKLKTIVKEQEEKKVKKETKKKTTTKKTVKKTTKK